jgi:hypothetical protein
VCFWVMQLWASRPCLCRSRGSILISIAVRMGCSSSLGFSEEHQIAAARDWSLVLLLLTSSPLSHDIWEEGGDDGVEGLGCVTLSAFIASSVLTVLFSSLISNLWNPGLWRHAL